MNPLQLQTIRYKIIGSQKCPQSLKAKKFCEELNLNYEWVESEQNPELLQQLKEKFQIQKTPIVFINQEFFGSYQELKKFVNIRFQYWERQNPNAQIKNFKNSPITQDPRQKQLQIFQHKVVKELGWKNLNMFGVKLKDKSLRTSLKLQQIRNNRQEIEKKSSQKEILCQNETWYGEKKILYLSQKEFIVYYDNLCQLLTNKDQYENLSSHINSNNLIAEEKEEIFDIKNTNQKHGSSQKCEEKYKPPVSIQEIEFSENLQQKKTSPIYNQEVPALFQKEEDQNKQEKYKNKNNNQNEESEKKYNNNNNLNLNNNNNNNNNNYQQQQQIEVDIVDFDKVLQNVKREQQQPIYSCDFSIPIVVISGFPSYIHKWKKWQRNMGEKSARILHFQVPGFDKIDERRGEKYQGSVLQICMLLNRFLDALGLQKVVLVTEGISIFIADFFTKYLYPQKVAGLAYFSVPGYFPHEEAEKTYLHMLRQFNTSHQNLLINRKQIYDECNDKDSRKQITLANKHIYSYAMVPEFMALLKYYLSYGNGIEGFYNQLRQPQLGTINFIAHGEQNEILKNNLGASGFIFDQVYEQKQRKQINLNSCQKQYFLKKINTKISKFNVEKFNFENLQENFSFFLEDSTHYIQKQRADELMQPFTAYMTLIEALQIQKPSL
ncbi:Thioredoxin-like fold [Pseudocohnilembus persalinus]|uniref:Thioredoxin-like fold n=1 Tax=Pseudocohnilembus persalinus TaxID=266149 RepID=A0A0V0QQB1_PSEPJ|nr:Thioredoxin-like fold [Pseudocohnilembus persalinus]|eukprot:KRX04494.1 Thioredoxin-like fold [Pseudocohnilembus persalinus]